MYLHKQIHLVATARQERPRTMDWLNNFKIAHKLTGIIVIIVIALTALSFYFLGTYKESLVRSNEDRIQHIVELAEDTVEHYYQLSLRSDKISTTQAQTMAKAALRDLRFGDNDYIFVYEESGVNLVTGPSPDLEGRNLISLKDENGVYHIRELIEAAKRDQGEYVNYRWPRGSSEETYPKLGYSTFFEPWGWMVGTGVYIDDIDKMYNAALREILLISGFVLLLSGAITFAIAISISKPLGALTGNMERLAKNDYNFEVKFTEFKDEIGKLARALSVFQENTKEVERLRKEQELAEERQAAERKAAMNKMADDFEEKVGNIVETVSIAAGDLEAMAAQLSAGVEETSQQSASVASASEQASSNVQTVAAAAEELSASIKDISRNVTETATTANQCADAASDSKEKLDALQESIGKIDHVLQAIMEVAEQTNLLALNATIEAARAGDAGKGFAVVASEVKGLANKTQSMTDEIASLIQSIKLSSGATIESVEDIMQRIQAVNEKTANVAAAVEEQDNSTNEISRNIQEASQGTNEVSVSVVDIQKAANDSAEATASLKDSSVELATQSRELKIAMAKFINEVREA